MTRAEKIVENSILASQSGSISKIIGYAIHEAADRLCTDWGELQHPVDVLREIANEVLELEYTHKTHEKRIAELEKRIEALEFVTDTSSYYE